MGKAGKYIMKSASAEEISKVFNEVFTDPSYAQNAKSIGEDLQKAAPKTCDIIIKAMIKEIANEKKRKQNELEPKITLAPKGLVEMKVTTKKPANFYIRAAGSLLTGHSKDGKEGKAAQEAKEPINHLRILGLSEAINVAVSVAMASQAKGLCTINKIQTAYPPMTGSGRRCAQIIIDVTRKV